MNLLWAVLVPLFLFLFNTLSICLCVRECDYECECDDGGATIKTDKGKGVNQSELNACVVDGFVDASLLVIPSNVIHQPEFMP